MIHRYPLWTLGPLGLGSAMFGESYQPFCALFGIVCFFLFTIPKLVELQDDLRGPKP